MVQLTDVFLQMHPHYLSDRGIRRALHKGKIRFEPAPEDGQIQPASLDIRIGRMRVFDPLAQRCNAQIHNDKGLQRLVEDPEEELVFTNYPDHRDIPIDIPPDSLFEVYLHETIQNKRGYDITADLRSGRGRWGFDLHSTFLEQGPWGTYLSVRNTNPNTIRLYGQSRFAQLFFHPRKPRGNGYAVQDHRQAARIADMISDGSLQTLGPFVLFQAGQHAFTFKKKRGGIDTKKKYAEGRLYHRHTLEQPFFLQTGKPHIIQLEPRINLPANIGIQLLHLVPYAHEPGHFGPDPAMLWLEPHRANAGWVDPGYAGHITAHPYRRKTGTVIHRGDAIALGVLIKFAQPVARPYGSKHLNSHYQNSAGDVAKS